MAVPERELLLTVSERVVSIDVERDFIGPRAPERRDELLDVDEAEPRKVYLARMQ